MREVQNVHARLRERGRKQHFIRIRLVHGPLATVAFFIVCTTAPLIPPPAKTVAFDVATHQWTKLQTEPYEGNQDDIVFITPTLGWYVNDAGKIFKTTDGGKPGR